MSRAANNPVKRPASSGSDAVPPRIYKAMRVTEITALLPEAASLLAEYGLHCFQCSAGAYETLEEGCQSHGFADEDIDDLVTDLNELLASRPARPATLAVTKEAALALAGILEAEGKAGSVLIVGMDEAGSFCLEFAETVDADHLEFSHPEVSSVRLASTQSTLSRIGGGTIDWREERFKLDLPEDALKGCACKSGGECGC